jgi:hypothetical protein
MVAPTDLFLPHVGEANMSAHTTNRCDCDGFYVVLPELWLDRLCRWHNDPSECFADGELPAINWTPGIADDLQALMVCAGLPNSGAVVITDILGCPLRENVSEHLFGAGSLGATSALRSLWG